MKKLLFFLITFFLNFSCFEDLTPSIILTSPPGDIVKVHIAIYQDSISEGNIIQKSSHDPTTKITVEIPVAWGDMDSFKHVNNTKFFKYFETARIKYFENTGFIETMEKDAIGPILASTSCKFIKPLFYPDTITAGSRVTSIESDSFTMEYIIVSKSKGVAAIGSSKMVVYDYKASKKATLPDSVRKKIREIDSI